jgi:hypothetical protein
MCNYRTSGFALVVGNTKCDQFRGVEHVGLCEFTKWRVFVPAPCDFLPRILLNTPTGF